MPSLRIMMTIMVKMIIMMVMKDDDCHGGKIPNNSQMALNTIFSLYLEQFEIEEQLGATWR